MEIESQKFQRTPSPVRSALPRSGSTKQKVLPNEVESGPSVAAHSKKTVGNHHKGARMWVRSDEAEVVKRTFWGHSFGLSDRTSLFCGTPT